MGHPVAAEGETHTRSSQFFCPLSLTPLRNDGSKHPVTSCCAYMHMYASAHPAASCRAYVH
eukprot:667979-Pelagomonas_calceolata.AAC.1